LASNPPQQTPQPRQVTSKQARNLSDADLLAALQSALTAQAQALNAQGWSANHMSIYSIPALINEADRRSLWQYRPTQEA
jgi:hypothetical protein